MPTPSQIGLGTFLGTIKLELVPRAVSKKQLALLSKNGDDRNRTCTPVKELDPKSSASANSATSPADSPGLHRPGGKHPFLPARNSSERA